MEQPLIVRYTQRVVTRLVLAVPQILKNQQWLIKEYLLRLRLENSMLLRALSGVALIPIEANYLCRVDH